MERGGNMDIDIENKYVIIEGDYVYKSPQKPSPSDYHDITESQEDREERIYLYSEVIE